MDITLPTIVTSAVSALFGAGVIAGTQRQKLKHLESEVEFLENVPARLQGLESKIDLLIALHDPRAANKLREIIDNEPSD